MPSEKVVVSAEEIERVVPEPNAPAIPGLNPVARKAVSPIPLWAKILLAVLVPALPVLCIVAAILKIASHTQPPRTRSAISGYLSTLLIISGLVATVAAVLAFSFTPIPAIVNSGMPDLDERTDFPKLDSATTLTSSEASSKLKPLVIVVSPATHMWSQQQEVASSSFGAGMLLEANKDGYLFATANHVASHDLKINGNKPSHVMVTTAVGLWSTADVIATSADADVALLWVQRQSGTGAFIQPLAAPSDGEPVFVIGHPEGLKYTLSTGLVSDLRDQIVQISAAISPRQQRWPGLRRARRPDCHRQLQVRQLPRCQRGKSGLRGQRAGAAQTGRLQVLWQRPPTSRNLPERFEQACRQGRELARNFHALYQRHGIRLNREQARTRRVAGRRALQQDRLRARAEAGSCRQTAPTVRRSAISSTTRTAGARFRTPKPSPKPAFAKATFSACSPRLPQAEMTDTQPIHVAAPSETDDDRFSRLRLIPWWDQGKIQAAHVLVVGAGALGNEILKNLALLGFSQVVVVDLDYIETSNLSRSVLFRAADVGSSKAEAIARGYRDLLPEATVRPLVANVMQDCGLGLFAWADLILGGLDNREARLWINRAAWKVNRPWIDGAIEGINGVARVFMPGQAPCYECTLGETDWAILNRRMSCNLLLHEPNPQGRVPTTPTISSIIGGIQAQEAVKTLHGLPTLAGKGYVFEGLHHTSYVVEYTENPDCMSHDTLEAIVNLPQRSAELTLAELLARGKSDLATDEAVVEFSRDIIHRLVCPRCGEAEDVFAPVGAIDFKRGQCAACSTEAQPQMRVVETLTGYKGEAFLAARTLDQLGLPLFDIFTVRTMKEEIGYCLAGDAAAVLGPVLGPLAEVPA